MAGGFLAVVNLFSGSVRSVDLSGQYLKAVSLANSKMSELEIGNYLVNDKSGKFENEENYRWELNIEPYDSNLNEKDPRIQLQKILLKVLWVDNGKPRNLELATLRLNGNTYPITDAKLQKLFKGGAVNISSTGNLEETNGPLTSSISERISGSITSNICGASTQNISGN